MISKRLQAVLAHVTGCRVLYDVGTDHARLPIEAVKRRLCEKAYAVDNKQGPLQEAVRNISAAGLEDYIEARLSEGVEDLAEDVECITIAGLGGKSIHGMLTGRRLPIKRLVLQPNNHPEVVRTLTQEGRLRIVDEDAIEENGVVYPILVFEPGEQTLSQKALWIGPILMHKRPEVYRQALRDEKAFLERLLEDIPHKQARLPLERKRALLEEVLHEWD